MAFIPKTNVVNGNTIQASDITNIIDSLNGTGLYDISATGSLLGSASFATTASYVQNTVSASFATTASYVQNAVSASYVLNAVSASFATTASYVLNVPPPSGPDAAVQFKSGSVFSGSANFKFDYTLNSLAQGSGNTVIGSNSHAEGENTKTGTQNAYYATSVSSGVVTLSSSYSDVSAEFVANNLLYLYDAPFDVIYSRAYFPISQSYYNAPNTIVELYDTSVTTTTAYVGDINYGVPNWTGDQTIPGDFSHAEGINTDTIGDYSHAEGSATSAVGQNSHAEGNTTQALGDGSHAEGSATRAIGVSSHTEGINAIASGSYSHAEGQITQAIGEGSHAEGKLTQAIGINSHAEGVSTQAVGIGSHAEGDSTQATGSYSHAEGSSTDAVGDYSHAEGNNTQASGSYSHAEGNNTQAIGIGSHAEGNNTDAIGDNSHAEGTNTQAIGIGSHAEGRGTIALGSWSHAEGNSTIASGSYQTVVGQSNTHGDATSFFIVGGSFGGPRKDAFKVTHSSSILIPQTQSAAPSWTGVDGEIIPATVSGTHYLYMWMSGAWRSSSFA